MTRLAQPREIEAHRRALDTTSAVIADLRDEPDEDGAPMHLADRVAAEGERLRARRALGDEPSRPPGRLRRLAR